MDQLDQIIAYEQGDLSKDDTISLFSNLIKSGTINHLQGHYGRTAQSLIQYGYLDRSGNILIVPVTF